MSATGSASTAAPRVSPDEARRLLVKDVSRLAVVATLVLAALLLLRLDSVRAALFDIDAVRRSLQAEHTVRAAVTSRLVFLGIGALLVGLGLPRIYLAVVAGGIYGAVEGSMLGLIASLGGAVIAWQLGRSLLASLVRRRLGGRFALWRERFRQDAFWWVLYGRLLPFTNSTIMNLLCGACRLRLVPYVAASALGFLPLTLAFAVLGSGGAKGSGWQIAGSLLLMVGAVVLQRAMRRRAGEASPEAPAL